MPAFNRRRWLSMAGSAAILAAILAFFYARTEGHAESVYFENVALLRQIQHLDARWELDALKSKIGINANYDPLAHQLIELNRLLERLDALITGPAHDDAAGLASAVKDFHRAVGEKSRLIEQFKSHNAVLRNSLNFLPTAAGDIRKSLDQTPGQDPAVLRLVSGGMSQVLLATLLYSQLADDDQAAAIGSALGRLEVAKAKLAPNVGEHLDIFVAHVRTILREHQAVTRLLDRIATVPTAARIHDIDWLLGKEEQRAVMRDQHNRRYLLLLSVVLAGLLLYTAGDLIHSHAVINRVNRELELANENLEERVQQRTAELRDTQAELVATARRAGMAEIATNMLHNVGNVLNSVNVSAVLVTGKVRASKVGGLAQAVQLMKEHSEDLGEFLSHDPKGKLLPGYLSRLVETLVKEHEAIVEELEQLIKSVEHIKDIVTTQQSYAGNSISVEPVQVGELVEDALRMNAGALTRHEVTVVREFAELPMLPLDRHRVLQILINLISNAKQAMAGTIGRAHRLTLRAEVAEAAAGQKLRLCVQDNGEGIAPENLTCIFAHGFTTRKNGHGFGLHSCALAAKEMGGTLTAHSDGLDQGAAFTLEIPIRTLA